MMETRPEWSIPLVFAGINMCLDLLMDSKPGLASGANWVWWLTSVKPYVFVI